MSIGDPDFRLDKKTPMQAGDHMNPSSLFLMGYLGFHMSSSDAGLFPRQEG